MIKIISEILLVITGVHLILQYMNLEMFISLNIYAPIKLYKKIKIHQFNNCPIK
jgi:hypothetical protein